MRVLLSIKPEYAKKIFDGSKMFEYRKSIFKNKEVKTVVVYASSPLKKVIGEFEIDFILNDTPEKLWHSTKDLSGITKEFFDEYFLKKEKGYAIKIKSVKKYSEFLSIKDKFQVSPPQSFFVSKKMTAIGYRWFARFIFKIASY